MDDEIPKMGFNPTRFLAIRQVRVNGFLGNCEFV